MRRISLESVFTYSLLVGLLVWVGSSKFRNVSEEAIEITPSGLEYISHEIPTERDVVKISLEESLIRYSIFNDNGSVTHIGSINYCDESLSCYRKEGSVTLRPTETN